MSIFVFPKIELDRVKEGQCTKCKKKKHKYDKRRGIKDPLCAECRRRYNEESQDWRSIIQDVLYQKR